MTYVLEGSNPFQILHQIFACTSLMQIHAMQESAYPDIALDQFAAKPVDNNAGFSALVPLGTSLGQAEDQYSMQQEENRDFGVREEVQGTAHSLTGKDFKVREDSAKKYSPPPAPFTMTKLLAERKVSL